MMTLKLLLNIQMISKMFTKILNNTIFGKKCKVFDDMIVDIINNKKLNPAVTELFNRGIKLNISIVFITQSYLKNEQKQLKIKDKNKLII